MKVIGPLGSVEARGKYAGALIYQQGPFGSKVYVKYPYKYTRTPAQKVARYDYSVCVSDWRIVPLSDWGKWSALAQKYRITGLNLFMMWWFQELFNSISGVGYSAGTISGAERTTPKINPYYMENVRKEIYGE